MIQSAKTSYTIAMDADDVSNVPRNFRGTNQLISGINMLGLLDCRMSGSAQPGAKGLLALKERVSFLSGDSSAVLVNLRHEPTAFVWGYVLSQYAPKNWAYPSDPGAQIDQVEADWLQELAKAGGHVHAQLIHSMNDDGTIKHSETIHGIDPKELSTEATAATNAGFVSKRFYVLDHSPPTWQQALDFRSWFLAQQPRPWMSYHCRKGKGRTTRFMCMHDMLLNAGKVSFNDIIERQWKIGGANLRSTVGEPPWKVTLIQEGLTQLENFYALVTPPQVTRHLVLTLRDKSADDSECK